MSYEYGEPVLRVALGDQWLFGSSDSASNAQWEPSEPDATATLWRYLSFAKFCSLLERGALFFSLVGDMADKYEGFIYPPPTRESGDPRQGAERQAHGLLQRFARSALINCWTKSDYESSLMWNTYAGTEGVAVRTTYKALRESLSSDTKLPITFGQVNYVDYGRQQLPMFSLAPLFHKRIEYYGEGEVRAVLPGPPIKEWDFPLDPDVVNQRGRYIPVSLDILVKDVVVSPHAAPWFFKIVKSFVRRAGIGAPVSASAIELPSKESAGGDSRD